MTDLSRALHACDGIAAYTPEGVRDRRAFAGEAGAVAAFLRTRADARVVLAAQDAWRFATGFFGCLAAGKTVVIPPNFLPATLRAIGTRSDIVLDDSTIARLDAIAPEPVVIALDARVELYTSGSTAEPARVTKCFSQLSAEVAVLETMFGACCGDAVVVGTVPHHHIYGLLFRVLWPLASGRPFVSAVCGEPHALCTTLARHPRSVIVSSPAHLSRVTQLVELGDWRERIADVFSSGGPLALTDAAAVEAALGRAPVEVYGSTESGGIGWRRQSAGAEWTPLDSVALALDDAGALVVRSPFAAADGSPLVTADAAEILDGGRFRLLGRLDRVVKIEEKRVSLAALEAKLREHPWVSDAATVLLASRRTVVAAAAVLEPEGSRTLERSGRTAVVGALRAHLAQYVEPVALPRRWRFPDVLPYDERGKLTRANVASLFGLPAA